MSDDALMKLWEGLGYYSRARNLKKAAQMIVETYGGIFPSQRSDLLALPGIGSYTAGAVASIAFGKRESAVDGNVLRVFARMTALRENVLLPEVKKRAEEELRGVMLTFPEEESDMPGAFTQAMIELGALVCVPNGPPRCGECPVRSFCRAADEGIAEELPVRIRQTKRRTEHLTVLIVRDGDRTAIRRREEKGLLAGLYEFPHLPGNVSGDEAVAAVEREGYTPIRILPLPPAKHLFTHVEWRMTGYEIRIAPREGDEGEWIFADREELLGEKAIPSAFSTYTRKLTLLPESGKRAHRDESK